MNYKRYVMSSVLLFKLCYNADMFMFPDTTAIFEVRYSKWLLVLCNGFCISKVEGGGVSLILSTKFDHSGRMLPNTRPPFGNLK